jgi:DNA polymerase-3 subunit alpha
LLRRAMGKKKAEEMAEHREIFRKGAAGNNIPAHKADEIFDLMERFAGYGFNKSHAAAYSLLAYHTAWVKVHYTAEFFCANMTVEMDDTDKLKVLYEDAIKMGMAFEAPNINRGTYRFEPISDKTIRYGLGAIKGSGEQAIEAIVAARERGGAFTSLYDFARRVDRSRLNKRTVEALIKAGAFDCLDLNRASLLSSVDRAFDFAATSEANANQGGLFDMGEDTHGSSQQEPEMVSAMPWGVKERLTQEKTALGFYLSGHLFDEVDREVRNFVKTRIDDLMDSREPQLLAGIVSDMKAINGQRGRLMIFKLDDKSASIEATADEATMNAYRNTLRDDELVVVMGKVQNDRFSGGLRLSISQVWDLNQARCRFGKYLRVAVNGTLPDIARIVREHPARVETTEQGNLVRGLGVRLQVLREGANAEIELGDNAKFFPTDAALASWMAQAHQGQSQIIYE